VVGHGLEQLLEIRVMPVDHQVQEEDELFAIESIKTLSDLALFDGLLLVFSVCSLTL